MVTLALATLGLVTHDDARPAFPAAHHEGQAVLSCPSPFLVHPGNGQVGQYYRRPPDARLARSASCPADQ